MFLKRFHLIAVLYSIQVFAGGLQIQAEYEPYITKKGDEVYLINQFSIGSGADLVNFEKVDTGFWNWKISGNTYDGNALLFNNPERGVGWLIKAGDDSLKIIIARDVRNTRDPRIISMTTSFVSGLFIVENFEAECNSYFKVYALKNSWDADVEYTGKYALEIANSSPCSDGKWKVKQGKLKVPDKILYFSIFAAVMTQNVRYLFEAE